MDSLPNYDRWKTTNPEEDVDLKLEECPRCQGLGLVLDGEEDVECPECGGYGFLDINDEGWDK